VKTIFSNVVNAAVRRQQEEQQRRLDAAWVRFWEGGVVEEERGAVRQAVSGAGRGDGCGFG
jgi:hypothetical protein